MLLAPPNDMGLPEQYTEWRDHQDEAVLHVIDSTVRFPTQIAPTGFGKSLTYMSAAMFSSNRAVFLTSTKGLMAQLMQDFGSLGLVEVKGRNSYLCKAETDGTTCDKGVCIGGVKCPYLESGCHYFDAVRVAAFAPLVSTNYAFWMSTNKYGRGIGKFDLMVCDEAHDLPNIVSDFLTFRLDKEDTFVEHILPKKYNDTHKFWKTWAARHIEWTESEVEGAKYAISNGSDGRQSRNRLARLLKLLKTMEKLTGLDKDWLIDVGDRFVSFAPIWPKEYANDVLFLDTPKVLLTSATVCQKTVDMMGVAREDCDLVEYPHSFPVENRRLIHIPTIQLNRHTDALGLRVWLTRIDQIIRSRQDRKGIIHTVSYARRDMVIKSSKFKGHMMSHNTGEATRVVAEFKQSDPPSYLVSPSMTTGIDMPYTDCEFQIIGKVAYPDSRDKIVAARAKEDKEYLPYCAMQQLVQACGRGVRHSDDRCENFIIDDSVVRFYPKYRHLTPVWFKDSFSSTTAIPAAPAKIIGGNRYG